MIRNFKGLAPSLRVRVLAFVFGPTAFVVSLFDGIAGGAVFGAMCVLMLFAANPCWLRAFLNSYGSDGWGPGPGRDPEPTPVPPEPSGGFRIANPGVTSVHPSLLPPVPKDLGELQALWAADAPADVVPSVDEGPWST